MESSEQVEWMNSGNCNNYEQSVMYPNDTAGVQAAKVICRSCVIRVECLEYALTNREKYGVWGGQSEGARRKILRLRSKPVSHAGGSANAAIEPAETTGL